MTASSGGLVSHIFDFAMRLYVSIGDQSLYAYIGLYVQAIVRFMCERPLALCVYMRLHMYKRSLAIQSTVSDLSLYASKRSLALCL